MTNFRSIPTLLATLFFCASAQTLQAKTEQSPEVQRSIAAYNSRNYAQAVAALKGTNSSLGHYYRALSYQALGRYTDAQYEYEWNYRKSTDKALRYQSWQGLQGLAKMRTSRSAASEANATAVLNAAAGDPSQNTIIPVANSAKPIKFGYTPQNESNQHAGISYTFTPGCGRHR
jgi:hypothetical protein